MPTLDSEDGPSPRTFEMTPFQKQCLRKRKAITLHIHRYHFESCNSTNEAAHDWLKTALPGSVGIFTTTHQIEGKGQRGTNWDQKQGKDLAWSIAFHWKSETSNQIRRQANAMFDLNKATTIAALQTINDALRDHCPPTSIKWPNDLFVKKGDVWSKCGGILIENTWQGALIIGTVIGIGINAQSTSLPLYRASLVEIIPDQAGDHIEPRILGKALEKNIRLAIENWKSACSNGAESVALFRRKTSAIFNRQLLARDKWKKYHWGHEEKCGKVLSVDEMGRCIVEWKTSEDSADSGGKKDAGASEAIENNKQLKWSWIYQQQNERTD
jgi:biotin-(acetyl-CoA carboxylase) ligase